MAPINDISMELHAFILKQLPTPRDVHSAICASPAYLHAFRIHKRDILEAIMLRAWWEYFPDAIAAQHASTVCSRDSRMKDWQFAHSRNPEHTKEAYYQVRRKRTTWYIEDPFRAQRTTDIYRNDVLFALWQMWFFIDFFVDDYCERTFAKLQTFRELRTPSPGTTRDLTVRHAYPLSRGERDRLTRAFLRFETYRRIFSGPDQNVWEFAHPDDVPQPHRAYLSRWWMWELEEIHAVHDYLKTRLEEVFDNIENTLVEKLRRAAERGEASLGEPTDQYNLDMLGFGIFQRNEKRNHERQIAFLMELGLPFLKTLFAMSPEEQLTVVTSEFARKKCLPSLDDVLQTLPYGAADFKMDEEDDPMDSVNVGWLLVLASADSDPRWEHGLRQLGHVFWDPLRSQRAELADIPADQYHTLPEKRTRAEEPSVEDRVEGLMIRPGALDDMHPDSSDPAETKIWVDSLDY